MGEAFGVTPPFHESVELLLINRQFDDARQLISEGNINQRDAKGNTLVIRACLANDLKRLIWLAQHGGDTNVQDKSCTPLLYIAIKNKNCSAKIVEWLVARRPESVNLVYNGLRPLHAAVTSARLNVIRTLVVAEADLDIQDNRGRSAMDIAKEKYKYVWNIVKWLVRYRTREILKQVTAHREIIDKVEDYCDEYGNAYFADVGNENMTGAEYAAFTVQIGILKWLKSKNVPVDNSLLKEYNLLVLGEIGADKSTFIEGFINYMKFRTLEDALNAELVHTEFHVIDGNLKSRIIPPEGTDRDQQGRVSSARGYVYRVGQIAIRFIETPGIGTISGHCREKNLFRLLATIEPLEYINGICIFLKSSTQELPGVVEDCLKKLLSRLHADACKNVIFFTNARSSYHTTAGDRMIPLRNIIDWTNRHPPNNVIPFTRQNVFAIDHEAFKYLIMQKSGEVVEETNIMPISWTLSRNVCIKFLKYIKRLVPHMIRHSVTLYEARWLVPRLYKPLAEVARLVQANIDLLLRYRGILGDGSKTDEELKKYLKIPKIGLRVTKLADPRVVCTNINCTETIELEGITTIHYKQICHTRCYDVNGLSVEVVGHHKLKQCRVFLINSRCNCEACNHHYRDHLHIHYETEPFIQEEDGKVGYERFKDTKRRVYRKLIDRANEYRAEMRVIQRSMAYFAHFLEANGIITINDSMIAQYNYVISREEAKGENCDQSVLAGYRTRLLMHENHRSNLGNLSEEEIGERKWSAEDLMNIVKNLYSLPLTGETIKEFDVLRDDRYCGQLFLSNGATVSGENMNQLFARIFN